MHTSKFRLDSLSLEHAEATRMPRPWFWGGAVPDLEAVVATALLQQHGVPAAAAPARSELGT